METVTHRSHIISFIILCVVVLISGCSTDSTATPTPSNTPTPQLDPSVTGVPTDIEATTPAATRTRVDYPTVTPHIYCEGVPETFLIIAERGQVTRTDGEETLNLRSGPGTDYDILVQMEPLESFYVVDGVQCNGGYAWFQVNYNGRIGWIAEGDEEQYYAEPHLTG